MGTSRTTRSRSALKEEGNPIESVTNLNKVLAELGVNTRNKNLRFVTDGALRMFCTFKSVLVDLTRKHFTQGKKNRKDSGVLRDIDVRD
jgi:hypothetical protein